MKMPRVQTDVKCQLVSACDACENETPDGAAHSMVRYDLIFVTVTNEPAAREHHACFQAQQMQELSNIQERRGEGRSQLLWVLVEDSTRMSENVRLRRAMARSGAKIVRRIATSDRTHGRSQKRALALNTIRELGAAGPVWQLDLDVFWSPEVLLEIASRVRPRVTVLLPVAHTPCGVDYARFSSDGRVLPTNQWVGGRPERALPVHLAGFAFHSSDLRRNDMWRGGESEFLRQLISESWVRLITLNRWFAAHRPLKLAEFAVVWKGLALMDEKWPRTLCAANSSSRSQPHRRTRHEQVLRRLLLSAERQLKPRRTSGCRMPNDVNFSVDTSRARRMARLRASAPAAPARATSRLPDPAHRRVIDVLVASWAKRRRAALT